MARASWRHLCRAARVMTCMKKTMMTMTMNAPISIMMARKSRRGAGTTSEKTSDTVSEGISEQRMSEMISERFLSERNPAERALLKTDLLCHDTWHGWRKVSNLADLGWFLLY